MHSSTRALFIPSPPTPTPPALSNMPKGSSLNFLFATRMGAALLLLQSTTWRVADESHSLGPVQHNGHAFNAAALQGIVSECMLYNICVVHLPGLNTCRDDVMHGSVLCRIRVRKSNAHDFSTLGDLRRARPAIREYSLKTFGQVRLFLPVLPLLGPSF